MAIWSRAFGGRGGNYPYLAARVRAMKPKLFPPEEYAKFLVMDVREIARVLEEGEYKTEIEELAGRMSGAQLVEAATRLNLARTYQRILKHAQGEAKLLLQLYLARYDVYNIKTILRGQRSKSPADEVIAALIPAGALGAEDLESMARLTNLEEVVSQLERTPFGVALREGQESNANLATIENSLDRRYYRLLVESVGATSEPNRAFLAYLKREVDAINLRTLLRLKLEGNEEAEGLFLAEGKDFTPDTCRRLLRAGTDEVANEVAESDFAAAADAVRATLTSRNLNTATNALDRELLQSAKSFSNRYPLSILPIIDFVLRKHIEATNLRAIAYGKQRNLKEEVVKELVFA